MEKLSGETLTQAVGRFSVGTTFQVAGPAS